MKHLLSLHIHGCFASVATGDRWLYRELPAADLSDLLHHKGTAGFAAAWGQLTRDNQRYFEEATLCIGEHDPLFVREVASIPGWTIYYVSDTEHYHKGLHAKGFGDHVDLTPLVETYKALGWTEEAPADYTTARKTHDAAEDAARIKRRTEERYVFPDTDADQPRAAFQGGLSDTLFNHPKVVEYMAEKTTDGLVSCWGYLGNSNRRVALDGFLESHLRDSLGWDNGKIADWLCSREGRHMADSYETMDDCLTHSFHTVEQQDAEVAAFNARSEARV